MEDKPEHVVTEERKEAEGAVARPFQTHALAARNDLRLDESRALPGHVHCEPLGLEQPPVRVPARDQRLVGVVEEIDVRGATQGRNQLVERHAAGDAALARGDAVLR